MIVFNCEQGTAEWDKLRMGIPTASGFRKIITPKTLQPSKQAERYLNELLVERMIGETIDNDVGELVWAARGSTMEMSARAWYEVTTDREVQRVGFVAENEWLTPEGMHGIVADWWIGCSPDGLVGDDGGLEIKCPSAAVHMSYLRHGIDKGYMTQVQGSLWITGREWWDTLSFNPVMPPALVRVERDEDYIDKLSRAVLTFTEFLRTETERMEITWPGLLNRVGREVEASV